MKTTISIVLLAGALLLSAPVDAAPALGTWQLDVRVGDVVWRDQVEIRSVTHGEVSAWSNRMGDMRGVLREGVIVLTSEYRPTEPMGTYVWSIRRPGRSGRYCSLHIYPLEGIPDAFALRSFWHKATVKRLG